jgi:hypothetical protein
MNDLDRCVEARLASINFSENEKLIEFRLRDVKEAEFSLIAKGVTRFLGGELREQNIVDRINMWNGENWSEDARPLLVELLIGYQADPVHREMDPIMEAEIDAVKRGVRLLIEIEAVYGFSALILCESLGVHG